MFWLVMTIVTATVFVLYAIICGRWGMPRDRARKFANASCLRWAGPPSAWVTTR